MRDETWLTHLVVVLALAPACKAQEGAKEAPRQEAKSPAAEIAKAAAKEAPSWEDAIRIDVRYDPARTAVVAAIVIAPGFHAYAEGETIGRPLKLEVSPESELQPDGAVQHPAGVVKDLPLGKSVIVEGNAEIVAKLASPSSGKKASGTLGYQVCTEEACDRPKTMIWATTVP